MRATTTPTKKDETDLPVPTPSKTTPRKNTDSPSKIQNLTSLRDSLAFRSAGSNLESSPTKDNYTIALDEIDNSLKSVDIFSPLLLSSSSSCNNKDGILSPVLGTEALYKQAGWLTPSISQAKNDREKQQHDLNIDGVEDGATNEEEAARIPTPKKLMLDDADPNHHDDNTTHTIPKSMQEIYQISNQNRRRNKDKHPPSTQQPQKITREQQPQKEVLTDHNPTSLFTQNQNTTTTDNKHFHNHHLNDINPPTIQTMQELDDLTPAQAEIILQQRIPGGYFHGRTIRQQKNHPHKKGSASGGCAKQSNTASNNNLIQEDLELLVDLNWVNGLEELKVVQEQISLPLSSSTVVD